MVALTPALGMAIFFFGLRALALTAVSVVSCVALEALYPMQPPRWPKSMISRGWGGRVPS